MSPPACSQQLRLQQAWCTWRQGKLAEAVEMYSSILDDDALCWQASFNLTRAGKGREAANLGPGPSRTPAPDTPCCHACRRCSTVHACTYPPQGGRMVGAPTLARVPGEASVYDPS